ncbi:flagellar hook protein FlgE [Pararhodospirillum oryzae]|uniref:Flagellar hook protein FlgE n=1 Tax=Pararhodospirillum oryzae TaxID=478448 RepID=A0A512HAE6_9PROT|nr:flagellar hook-basal body complex protein [Pararhodospirillum oryzae]GEO82370.1 flagellar basal body protein [Pararhodospirillum oryzae]
MSLLGALIGSSMAMSAQSDALGQVSGNIINMNTIGYKHADVTFKTLLSGSTPNWNFFSTAASVYRRVDEQGTVTQTGRSLDVAINGTGMFVVNNQVDMSGETMYTRDGSFDTAVVYQATGTSIPPAADNPNQASDAYLVTGSGRYVLGWAANQDAYDNGLNPFPTNDANGAVQAGAELVPIRVNSEAMSAGSATTQATLRANLDASATSTQMLGLSVWGNEVQTTQGDGTVVSSWPRRGIPLLFTPVAGDSGAWTVGVSTDNGMSGTIQPTSVRFNGDGQLVEPTDGNFALSVTYADGTTQDISLNLGSVTQYASVEGSVVQDSDVNGFPSGSLVRTSFDNEGVLYADYSNGVTRPLYKLALADFPAAQNLEMQNGNLYRYVNEAGDRRLFVIDDILAGSTQLTPNALEQSTVELSDQFSTMITTQTAYSQAANVFRTVDEMTQTAAALKR